MVAISVDDAMRCGYLIEWVEQVLETTIHAIEEISGDTEEFNIFGVDFLYDIAEECLTINVSYMDIGDEGNFFTMPVFREILDGYGDVFYHGISGMIEAIERCYEGYSETNLCDESVGKWYPYEEFDTYRNPGEYTSKR